LRKELIVCFALAFLLSMSSVYAFGTTFPYPSPLKMAPGETRSFKFEIQNLDLPTQAAKDIECGYSVNYQFPLIVEFAPKSPTAILEGERITINGVVTALNDAQPMEYTGVISVTCVDRNSGVREVTSVPLNIVVEPIPEKTPVAILPSNSTTTGEDNQFHLDTLSIIAIILGICATVSICVYVAWTKGWLKKYFLVVPVLAFLLMCGSVMASDSAGQFQVPATAPTIGSIRIYAQNLGSGSEYYELYATISTPSQNMNNWTFPGATQISFTNSTLRLNLNGLSFPINKNLIIKNTFGLTDTWAININFIESGYYQNGTGSNKTVQTMAFNTTIINSAIRPVNISWNHTYPTDWKTIEEGGAGVISDLSGTTYVKTTWSGFWIATTEGNYTLDQTEIIVGLSGIGNLTANKTFTFTSNSTQVNFTRLPINVNDMIGNWSNTSSIGSIYINTSNSVSKNITVTQKTVREMTYTMSYDNLVYRYNGTLNVSEGTFTPKLPIRYKISLYRLTNWASRNAAMDRWDVNNSAGNITLIDNGTYVDFIIGTNYAGSNSLTYGVWSANLVYVAPGEIITPPPTPTGGGGMGGTPYIPPLGEVPSFFDVIIVNVSTTTSPHLSFLVHAINREGPSKDVIITWWIKDSTNKIVYPQTASTFLAKPEDNYYSIPFDLYQMGKFQVNLELDYKTGKAYAYRVFIYKFDVNDQKYKIEPLESGNATNVTVICDLNHVCGFGESCETCPEDCGPCTMEKKGWENLQWNWNYLFIIVPAIILSLIFIARIRNKRKF